MEYIELDSILFLPFILYAVFKGKTVGGYTILTSPILSAVVSYSFNAKPTLTAPTIGFSLVVFNPMAYIELEAIGFKLPPPCTFMRTSIDLSGIEIYLFFVKPPNILQSIPTGHCVENCNSLNDVSLHG